MSGTSIMNHSLHLLAVIFFIAAAFIMHRKGKIEGRYLFIGAVVMNVALATFIIGPDLLFDNYELKSWVDWLGLLSPAGYLIMGLAVFSLARGIERPVQAPNKSSQPTR